MEPTETAVIGLIVGLTIAVLGIAIYYAGYSSGKDTVYSSDHYQAAAGVFIDGLDRNKVYRLCP